MQNILEVNAFFFPMPLLLDNHIEVYGERIVESLRFKCLYYPINAIFGIYRRLHDISWMVQVLWSVQHNDFCLATHRCPLTTLKSL